MSRRGSRGAAHGDDESPPPALPSLREYALLADGERGALVGPDGDIPWLCAPQWHDDAVLSQLIGGSGCYSISPWGRWVSGGSYEHGTLIWNGRWVTTTGLIGCRQALALPADPHRLVLLRQVQALDEPARVRVELDIRAGFGRYGLRELRRTDDGVWTARSGPLRVRWSGAGDARVEDRALVVDLQLPAGASADLVLEISTDPLPDPPVADRLWDLTVDAWAKDVPDLGASIAPRDAEMAYAVMRGLTASTGGMVAAATMGIPERAERRRNYDYRYVWLRDQCYAGLAADAADVELLLDRAALFVGDRVLADGPKTRPAYRLDGGPVPEERVLDLPGYPGGRVKVGNWVNDQYQLDAMGEVLQLLSAAARRDRLDSRGWQALETAAGLVEERWQLPDAGIWELSDAWWTHSRLASVAGLRAFAGVCLPRDSARWLSLADAITAETARRCLHPDGRWQRTPDDVRVDAALLLPPVRGALPHGDPRTVATLDAVVRDLGVDYYVYRYAADDQPLGAAEGAFLLCGFMASLAQHDQGNRVEAMRWFERTRAACGSPGLFTEEYDVQQRELRGNLPQAFVHALLLESSFRLAD